MGVITDLFAALAAIVTGLFTSLAEALTGVTEIFYISSGENAGFTVLGALLLIGFGLFFVMFAWRVIQGLLKR